MTSSDEWTTRQPDYDDSTIADVVVHAPRSTATQRVAATLLVLVVLAGAVGLAGIRTSTVHASADGWGLAVTYPRIARAGDDATWALTITAGPDGFPDQLDVLIDRHYLDVWETQRFYPEPSEETADGDTLRFTFDTPDSDTLVIRFDGYVQPTAHSGRTGTVAVELPSGGTLSTDFTTTLLP